MTETTPRTIHEVVDQYIKAFRLHDSTLLEDLIPGECVIEDTSPAPDLWRCGCETDRTTVCLPIADRSVSNTPYGL